MEKEAFETVKARLALNAGNINELQGHLQAAYDTVFALYDEAMVTERLKGVNEGKMDMSDKDFVHRMRIFLEVGNAIEAFNDLAEYWAGVTDELVAMSEKGGFTKVV